LTVGFRVISKQALFKSRIENHLALAIISRVSSVLGCGEHSLSVILFGDRHSTQNPKSLFFFLTEMMGEDQGVSDSITPCPFISLNIMSTPTCFGGLHEDWQIERASPV
jgi:hypothetical protein